MTFSNKIAVDYNHAILTNKDILERERVKTHATQYFIPISILVAMCGVLQVTKISMTSKFFKTNV